MTDKHREYEWMIIFRDKHLVNVIYLGLFILFIIGTWNKFDIVQSQKYAKAYEMVEVKKDIDKLELILDRRLGGLETKINNIYDLLLKR